MTSAMSDSGFTSHPSGTGPRGVSAEAGGEGGEGVGGHAGEGGRAGGLGLHRLEVHEPRLEHPPANPSNFAPVRRFCSILSSRGPSVNGDGPLFFDRWERDWSGSSIFIVQNFVAYSD